MGFWSTITSKVKEVYTKADVAVGGYLPGGPTPTEVKEAKPSPPPPPPAPKPAPAPPAPAPTPKKRSKPKPRVIPETTKVITKPLVEAFKEPDYTLKEPTPTIIQRAKDVYEKVDVAVGGALPGGITPVEVRAQTIKEQEGVIPTETTLQRLSREAEERRIAIKEQEEVTFGDKMSQFGIAAQQVAFKTGMLAEEIIKKPEFITAPIQEFVEEPKPRLKKAYEFVDVGFGGALPGGKTIEESPYEKSFPGMAKGFYEKSRTVLREEPAYAIGSIAGEIALMYVGGKAIQKGLKVTGGPTRKILQYADAGDVKRVTTLSRNVDVEPFLRNRAVIIVKDKKGRILYEMDKVSGMNILPGGAIDAGETALNAAKRELFEETGLRLKLTPSDIVSTAREKNIIFTAYVDDLSKLKLTAQAGEVEGFSFLKPSKYTGPSAMDPFGKKASLFGKAVRSDDLYIGSRAKTLDKVNDQLSKMSVVEINKLGQEASEWAVDKFGDAAKGIRQTELVRDYMLSQQNMLQRKLVLRPVQETFVRRGEPAFLKKRVIQPTFREPSSLLDWAMGKKPGQFKKFQKTPPTVMAFGSRYDIPFKEARKLTGQNLFYTHGTPTKIPIYKGLRKTKVIKRDIKHIVFDLDRTLIDGKGNLRPDALKLLRKLKREGKTISLWTHSKKKRTMKILEKNKIKKYFDNILTREDYAMGKSMHTFKDIKRIGGDILIDDSLKQITLQKKAGNLGLQITKYKGGKSAAFKTLYSEIKEIEKGIPDIKLERGQFFVDPAKTKRGESVLHFHPPASAKKTGQAYLSTSYLGLQDTGRYELTKISWLKRSPSVYQTRARAGKDLIFTRKAIAGSEFEVGATAGTIFKVTDEMAPFRLKGKKIRQTALKIVKDKKIDKDWAKFSTMSRRDKLKFLKKVKKETGVDYSESFIKYISPYPTITKSVYMASKLRTSKSKPLAPSSTPGFVPLSSTISPASSSKPAVAVSSPFIGPSVPIPGPSVPTAGPPSRPITGPPSRPITGPPSRPIPGPSVPATGPPSGYPSPPYTPKPGPTIPGSPIIYPSRYKGRPSTVKMRGFKESNIYQAQVKKGGRWRPFKTKGTKSKVISRAEQHLRSTLAASMRVKNIKTNKFVNIQPKKGFRKSRNPKLPFTIVEKKNKRLSRRSEVSAIHAIKRRTPKKKKKK